MSHYKYASGDLMGHPQTYFYTQFEGPEFFRGWWSSRQNALGSLPPPCDAPAVDTEASGTAGLLESAFAEATSACTTAASLPFHAETVLRKYEVGKRIYDFYDENLKPASKQQYRTHAYYVRVGESFDAAHAAVGDLRALNALLKCLDTLTAHVSELDAGLGARVARLILNERKHVGRLAATLEIEIP